jgi:hypothetical protein
LYATLVKDHLLVKSRCVLYMAVISSPALTLHEPAEMTSRALWLVPPQTQVRRKSVTVEPTRERILGAAAQLFAKLPNSLTPRIAMAVFVHLAR